MFTCLVHPNNQTQIFVHTRQMLFQLSHFNSLTFPLFIKHGDVVILFVVSLFNRCTQQNLWLSMIFFHLVGVRLWPAGNPCFFSCFFYSILFFLDCLLKDLLPVILHVFFIHSPDTCQFLCVIVLSSYTKHLFTYEFLCPCYINGNMPC